MTALPNEGELDETLPENCWSIVKQPVMRNTIGNAAACDPVERKTIKTEAIQTLVDLKVEAALRVFVQTKNFEMLRTRRPHNHFK